MATHSSISCLENPRDREAWWATVHGVAQSQTRPKQLSSSSSRNRMGPAKHKESDKYEKAVVSFR